MTNHRAPNLFPSDDQRGDMPLWFDVITLWNICIINRFFDYSNVCRWTMILPFRYHVFVYNNSIFKHCIFVYVCMLWHVFFRKHCGLLEQVGNHQMNQCWARSMMSHGIIGPHCVDVQNIIILLHAWEMMPAICVPLVSLIYKGRTERHVCEETLWIRTVEKPSSEPVLNKIHDVTWHHWTPLSWCAKHHFVACLRNDDSNLFVFLWCPWQTRGVLKRHR